MPLFKVTGANGINAKQAGAPGTSSSLPRLIKYVCYYNSSFNHQLGSLPTDFPCLRQIQKNYLRSIYILQIKTSIINCIGLSPRHPQPKLKLSGKLTRCCRNWRMTVWMVRYSEKLASITVMIFFIFCNSSMSWITYIPDITLLREFNMDKLIFPCWKSV